MERQILLDENQTKNWLYDVVIIIYSSLYIVPVILLHIYSTLHIPIYLFRIFSTG